MSKDIYCQNCGVTVGRSEPTTLGGQAGGTTWLPNHRSRTMIIRYARGATGPIDIPLCADCDSLSDLDLDKLARNLEMSWLQEMTDAGSTQAEIEATKADWPVSLTEKSRRQES